MATGSCESNAKASAISSQPPQMLTALLSRNIDASEPEPRFGYFRRLACCALLGGFGLLLTAAEPGSVPATSGFWYGHGHAKAVQSPVSVTSVNYDYDTDFWFDVDDHGKIDGFAVMRGTITLDDHKLRNLIKWVQKMAGAAPSATGALETSLREYLSERGGTLSGPAAGSASAGSEPAELPAPDQQPAAPTKPPLQFPATPTTKPPLQLPANPSRRVAAAVAPGPPSPLGSLGELENLIRTLLVGNVVGLRLGYDEKMPVITGRVKGQITGNQMTLHWEPSPRSIAFTTLREELTGDTKIGGGQAPAIDPFAKTGEIQPTPNGLVAFANGKVGPQLTLYWSTVRVQPRRPIFDPEKVKKSANAKDPDDAYLRPPIIGLWRGAGHAKGVQNTTEFTVTNWDYDSDFWFAIDDKGGIDGFAVMRCDISLDDHKFRNYIANELKEAGDLQARALRGRLGPVAPMLTGAYSPNTVGLRLGYDNMMPIVASRIKGRLTKDDKVTLDWATPPQRIPFTDRREELTMEPKIGGGQAPVINPWAKPADIQTFRNGVTAFAKARIQSLR